MLIKYIEKQKRVKTNIKKQVVLLDILYKLINKVIKYLCNILFKLYKEISLLSKSPRCCFNCNNSLQAYKEYNIIVLYTKNIAKSKYLSGDFVTSPICIVPHSSAWHQASPSLTLYRFVGRSVVRN